MKKILLSVGALLSVFMATAQQRVPLFEVFTSSTCPPCKPGNEIYEGIVTTKPSTEYVSVKYQEYFPGNGDPYTTNETVSRLNYYAINSVPRMEIDGGWDKNAQNFTGALYTSARAVAPKFNLTGTYSLKNKVVTAYLKYSPIIAATGATLHVAIVETKTVKNKKSNGETEFFNVVKKMLPDASGTALPALGVGKKDSTTLTFTFAGAYRLPADGKSASRISHATEHSVEDFANLRVVAWIQGANKEVFQAANLTKTSPLSLNEITNAIGEISVYPNPASNMINVDLSMTKADQIQAKLVNVAGAVVATKVAACIPGSNKISIDVANLPNGVYNLIVFDSENNSNSQMVSVSR